MNPTNIYPSYNDIHNECILYANSILEQGIQFDCVVGLARGGIFPSSIVARVLNIPLQIIAFSSSIGLGDNKLNTEISDNVFIYDSKILIIDDIADTGSTLHEMCNHYESLGNEVTTYAVYYKLLQTPLHVPNYSIGLSEDAGWVCFPFENTELML
jgi:hypoxanthine phosphoribosyltransferase